MWIGRALKYFLLECVDTMIHQMFDLHSANIQCYGDRCVLQCSDWLVKQESFGQTSWMAWRGNLMTGRTLMTVVRKSAVSLAKTQEWNPMCPEQTKAVAADSRELEPLSEASAKASNVRDNMMWDTAREAVGGMTLAVGVGDGEENRRFVHTWVNVRLLQTLLVLLLAAPRQMSVSYEVWKRTETHSPLVCCRNMNLRHVPQKA